MNVQTFISFIVAVVMAVDVANKVDDSKRNLKNKRDKK